VTYQSIVPDSHRARWARQCKTQQQSGHCRVQQFSTNGVHNGSVGTRVPQRCPEHSSRSWKPSWKVL